jgi:predicted peptidase
MLARHEPPWYTKQMPATHRIALILLMIFAPFVVAQGSTHPDVLYADHPTVIDLSTTIDAQAYPCVVIINKAAKRGGPAILFLHGYGECGTDNRRQTTVGLPRHALAKPDQWPFVLIVPQKPIHNSEWEEHEHAVLHFLDEAAKQGLYDPDKLAITGLSQGGHGTMMLAKAHPDRFVAAAPVCGYLRPVFTQDRERIEHAEPTRETPEFVAAATKLKGLPTWLWHGDADKIVPPADSRALYDALKALDADTRYTELPGVNHNAWDPAYTSTELSDWFKQQLNE